MKSLEENPSDANFLCLAGQALIALQRLDEARVQIEKATSGYPEFSVAHETFADLMLAEGRFEAAIESYETAIKLKPGGANIGLKLERARELIKQMTAENAVCRGDRQGGAI